MSLIQDEASTNGPDWTGLTPAERALRALSAAYSQHAIHDPRETTKAAREAFLKKFIDAVDPERKLPEAERLRRAACARKAHFARMALQSAKARRRKMERAQ